jgi:hypothetical protein
MRDYIKYRQKQWEDLMQRDAELEAKKEAVRVAKMEAEARMQEEIVARKKLLPGNGNHGTFAAISGNTTAYPTWEKT